MMYSPPWSVKVLLSICPRKQAVGFQTFFALNFFPKAVENKLSKSVDTKSCDTNLSHWQEKGLEVRRWVWSGRPSTSSFPHPPPHSSGILPALPQSHCLQPSWGLRCFFNDEIPKHSPNKLKTSSLGRLRGGPWNMLSSYSSAFNTYLKGKF